MEYITGRRSILFPKDGKEAEVTDVEVRVRDETWEWSGRK
jgi:hypothetical protein